MLYQNDTAVAPDGAVKVWLTFESPLVGLALPSSTACVPECTGPVTIEVVPVRVQPVKSPVSKPPLTTGLGGGPALYVAVYVASAVGVTTWDCAPPSDHEAN